MYRRDDGREELVSIFYLGCNRPAEVRFGETTLSIADFLTEVAIYLEGDGAEVDLRRTIREALSRANLHLRPTSGARTFETPPFAKDCNCRDAPPFNLGGARLPARDLYDFLCYLMQKFDIESFPGDTREHFLRRYCRDRVCSRILRRHSIVHHARCPSRDGAPQGLDGGVRF